MYTLQTIKDTLIMSTTLSIRLPDDVKEQIDTLAKISNRRKLDML